MYFLIQNAKRRDFLHGIITIQVDNCIHIRLLYNLEVDFENMDTTVPGKILETGHMNIGTDILWQVRELILKSNFPQICVIKITY